MQAGKLLGLQYAEPYAAEVYALQQQKWDAKRQRDADREAQKAARASAAVA